ncbi:hypothetical protein QYE76_035030 [Lolium multiflorum]|uniref:Uncharacterized protein n=1 Tax=Lolium multiflorum TaxID=4521 RepID=A0AAD8VKS8_LOLMU|nr:hypothetical protein QYE76_035030 [Lolium multiflorum]
MRFFVTCDPANVQHILAANYANFLKGAEFAAIFDIMSGSLFTVDGEQCRRQRAKFLRVVTSPRFVAGMAARCRDKVEKGLLPLFARLAGNGAPFDVQEVLSRFMFDLTTMSIFGVDPGLVSLEMPLQEAVDAPAAMDTVLEVAFFRHTVPACCWKALRWLNIGPERKLSAAHAVLQGFVTGMMERRKINGGRVGSDEDQDGLEDLLVKLHALAT